MSYANPFRDTLKLDDARYHWETHVLNNEGMHADARARRAVKNGITYDEQLDQEFMLWHNAKKLTGFDNFTPNAISEDN